MDFARQKPCGQTSGSARVTAGLIWKTGKQERRHAKRSFRPQETRRRLPPLSSFSLLCVSVPLRGPQAVPLGRNHAVGTEANERIRERGVGNLNYGSKGGWATKGWRQCASAKALVALAGRFVSFVPFCPKGGFPLSRNDAVGTDLRRFEPAPDLPIRNDFALRFCAPIGGVNSTAMQ